MNNKTIKITLPADQELGRINEALRADLWREAHAARAELRAQMALYQGKRPDQVAYSLLAVLLCAAAGLALGATVALFQSDGIDGYRSEGVPVSCWHFRE